MGRVALGRSGRTRFCRKSPELVSPGDVIGPRTRSAIAGRPSQTATAIIVANIAASAVLRLIVTDNIEIFEPGFHHS